MNSFTDPLAVSDPVDILAKLRGLDGGIRTLSENPKIVQQYGKDIRVLSLQVIEIMTVVARNTWAPSRSVRSFLDECISNYHDLLHVLSSLGTPTISRRARSKLRRTFKMRHEILYDAFRSFRRSVLALWQVVMQNHDMQSQRDCFDRIFRELANLHTSPPPRVDALQEPANLSPSTIRYNTGALSPNERAILGVSAVPDPSHQQLDAQQRRLFDNSHFEARQHDHDDPSQQDQTSNIFARDFNLSGAVFIEDPKTGLQRSVPVRMRWDSQFEVNIISRRIIKRTGQKTRPVNETLKWLGGMEIQCTESIHLTWYDDRSPVTNESDFYVIEDGDGFDFDIILRAEWGQDNLEFKRKGQDTGKYAFPIRLKGRPKGVKADEQERKRKKDEEARDNISRRDERERSSSLLAFESPTPSSSSGRLHSLVGHSSPLALNRTEANPIARLTARVPSIVSSLRQSVETVIAGPSNSSQTDQMSERGKKSASSVKSIKSVQTIKENGNAITGFPMHDTETNLDGTSEAASPDSPSRPPSLKRIENNNYGLVNGPAPGPSQRSNGDDNLPDGSPTSLVPQNGIGAENCLIKATPRHVSPRAIEFPVVPQDPPGESPNDLVQVNGTMKGKQRVTAAA